MPVYWGIITEEWHKTTSWFIQHTLSGRALTLSTSPLHCKCKTSIELSLLLILMLCFESMDGASIFFGGFPIDQTKMFYEQQSNC